MFNPYTKKLVIDLLIKKKESMVVDLFSSGEDVKRINECLLILTNHIIDDNKIHYIIMLDLVKKHQQFNLKSKNILPSEIEIIRNLADFLKKKIIYIKE